MNSLNLANSRATTAQPSSLGGELKITPQKLLNRISRLVGETADKVEQFSRDYHYRKKSNSINQSWMSELGIPNQVEKVKTVLGTIKDLQPYMVPGSVIPDEISDTLKAISYTVATGEKKGINMSKDEFEKYLIEIDKKEYEREQSKKPTSSAFGWAQGWFPSSIAKNATPRSNAHKVNTVTSSGVPNPFESLSSVLREGSQLLNAKTTDQAYDPNLIADKLTSALSVLSIEYDILEHNYDVERYKSTANPQPAIFEFPVTEDEAVAYGDFDLFSETKISNPTLSWFQFDPDA